MVEVVGFKRMKGTSRKSGRPYAGYQIYGLQEREGIEGRECCEFFASDEMLGGLIPSLGDCMELSYGKGFSGQAYLQSIKLV